MKTKAFGVILALCLAAGLMGVMSGCNNDEDDDLLDGNDGIFEELLKEDMTHFEGNDYTIFDFHLFAKELKDENVTQCAYCDDRPIRSSFTIAMDKADLKNTLDGGDVLVDKNFMAIFNERGKLVRKIDFKKMYSMNLLVALVGHPDYRRVEYSYVWEDKDGHPLLPPGKYVSLFTIQYNATPGTGTKTMKPLTFRKSFEIVRTK